MKLAGKIVAYPLMAVNILVALMLIFSCYGSLAAPIGRWPFASLSGLAFPFLYLLNLIFLLLWLLFWKKGAVVPFVTILICLVPTLNYCPIHFSKANKLQEPYITVMTYNTEGFGIDDNKNRTLDNPVLKYIMDQDADLIFLQEAAQDVMKKISADRNIKKTYPYICNPNGTAETVCISKYPVISSESVSFDNTSNGCLYIRILIGRDTLAVYNCHLQSNHLGADEFSQYHRFIENPTDSTHYDVTKTVIKKLLESTSHRAVQARMIADRARSETAKYVIVCGDFNDTPLSYSHHVFDRFMRDTYAKSGAGLGITYHEHRLYYRIDHLFCSRNIKPLYTWVDRTMKDSDHYPIISMIRLQ